MRTNLTKKDIINAIYMQIGFSKQITENLDYGLTVYGSIAHELPLLGVKVINASLDNPHKAFNFSITPNNLSEYTKILNNLTKVKKKNTNTKSIYEFYYMLS